MKSWEIQRKKAEKRRREAQRREKKRAGGGNSSFRLVKRDPSTGSETESLVASVIVKNNDESVYDASYEEVQPGMTVIVEGPSGLIERAVVEEKVDSEAEGEAPLMRICRKSNP